MSDNSPADNTADLANTVKEMLARLTTVESQLKAQSEEMRTLRAEKGELKANRTKQEKDLFEVRGTCAEVNDRYNMCDVFKDKYNAVKSDNDQLKSRVDELDRGQPYPPLSLSSPTPLHPNQRPEPHRSSSTHPPFHPHPFHLSTPHFPRPPLETFIFAFR